MIDINALRDMPNADHDLVDIHTSLRAKYKQNHYLGSKRISHDIDCLKELKRKPKPKHKDL